MFKACNLTRLFIIYLAVVITVVYSIVIIAVCNVVFQACDNGRGAVLLSVARGKVSEGIDFGKFSASLANT